MPSPLLEYGTRPQLVSTAGRSIPEQIKIQKLTQTAFCTWVTDRVDDYRHTSDALLRSARDHQSQGDLRAAQAALDRAREQLNSVLGPSRVKSLPAQR